MANGRFIAYYRVSTVRQGQSGLGLEAQQKAVADYLSGGSWVLTASFTEIESGRRNDRPELAKALALCRATGATLLIARLDRLTRNASFLLSLKDAGVDFIAVDQPHANRLTIGILALVAEDEAEKISARTKAALAAARACGTKLGNPDNLTNRAEGTARSAQVRAAAAAERARDLQPIIAEMQTGGITSLSGIAQELMRRGIPTARGAMVWQPTQVRALLNLLP